MKDTDLLIFSALRKARQHPDYDGTRCAQIVLACYSEFEPWGEATEAFEDVWVVQLPALEQSWRGRTLKGTLERAMSWLECEEEKRP